VTGLEPATSRILRLGKTAFTETIRALGVTTRRSRQLRKPFGDQGIPLLGGNLYLIAIAGVVCPILATSSLVVAPAWAAYVAPKCRGSWTLISGFPTLANRMGWVGIPPAAPGG
jgi:hypothetical protein